MRYVRVISIFVLSFNLRVYMMLLTFCMWLSCVFLLGRECAILLSGHLGFIVLECVRDVIHVILPYVVSPTFFFMFLELKCDHFCPQQCFCWNHCNLQCKILIPLERRVYSLLFWHNLKSIIFYLSSKEILVQGFYYVDNF
jgi:hypothetical protein